VARASAATFRSCMCWQGPSTFAQLIRRAVEGVRTKKAPSQEASMRTKRHSLDSAMFQLERLALPLESPCE
jgi:hypothetical protein